MIQRLPPATAMLLLIAVLQGASAAWGPAEGYAATLAAALGSD
jgi:hypothetical protein